MMANHRRVTDPTPQPSVDPRYLPGGGKPASGIPAGGYEHKPARGEPASGVNPPFTPGPDGTGAEAAKTGHELNKQRREAAKSSYSQEHVDTAARIGRLQRKRLDSIEKRYEKGEITDEQLGVMLADYERPLDRLIGKPTQQVEGRHEVSISNTLKQLASKPLPPGLPEIDGDA